MRATSLLGAVRTPATHPIPHTNQRIVTHRRRHRIPNGWIDAQQHYESPSCAPATVAGRCAGTALSSLQFKSIHRLTGAPGRYRPGRLRLPRRLRSPAEVLERRARDRELAKELAETMKQSGGGGRGGGRLAGKRKGLRNHGDHSPAPAPDMLGALELIQQQVHRPRDPVLPPLPSRTGGAAGMRAERAPARRVTDAPPHPHGRACPPAAPPREELHPRRPDMTSQQAPPALWHPRWHPLPPAPPPPASKKRQTPEPLRAAPTPHV
eukprot:scaffold10399_cov94-Isochrysis_galbana.AAC.5